MVQSPRSQRLDPDKAASPASLQHQSEATSNTTTDTSTLPIYFGSRNSKDGYLSAYFPAPFSETRQSSPPCGSEVLWTNKLTFNSCKQYMLHHKMLLFDRTHTQIPDYMQREKLRSAEDVEPFLMRSLSRQVPNFDEEKWAAARYELAKRANFLKFSQNEELKRRLLETGSRLLVNASPTDRIWGVGFDAEEAEKVRSVEGKWGKNMLGKILMEVRDFLREAEKNGKKVDEDDFIDPFYDVRGTEPQTCCGITS